MEETTKPEISKLEIYKAYLTKEGYRPEVDSDGDLIFKKEGGSYCIIVDEKDREYFRLVYTNFWPIENDNERLRVLKACDYATARTKVAKVYIVKNNVWATVELFLPNPQDFEPIFERLCRTLTYAVKNFADTMKGKDEKK